MFKATRSFSTAAIVALACSAAGGATATPPGSDADQSVQVIGGSNASQRYPWMASIGGCGGALIAPQWIVTAAHCVDRRAPYGALLNTNDKMRGGERIRVEYRVVHPGFAGDYKPGNDIAVLKLTKPAKARPIPIAAADGPTGTATRILGWGATNPRGGSYPRYLQELNTSITAPERCHRSDKLFQPDFEICTDNPGGRSGACYGDSGGPQIKRVSGRWELIGATSRGSDPCAAEPSIYTSVPKHLDWLRQVTGNDL